MLSYFETTEKGSIKVGLSEKTANWIHFEDPSKHEMQHFAKKYHLPTMLFEVAQDVNEVARFEQFTTEDNETLWHICLLVPVKTHDSESHAEYITRPFSFIISNGVLLTVGHQQMSLVTEIAKLEISNQQIENIILQSIRLIYQRYLDALGVIDQQIHQLETNVHVSTRNKLLYSLKSLKKSVVYLDLASKSNQQILPQLTDATIFEKAEQREKLFYGIQIRYTKTDKAITTYKELLTQLSDLLSDIISNRLNNIMKTLTSLSIILTVPTMIGGFWGMNVPVPLTKSPAGFGLLLLLTLIISGLVGWWLKKKDYM